MPQPTESAAFTSGPSLEATWEGEPFPYLLRSKIIIIERVPVSAPFHNYDSVICKYEFVIFLPIYFEIYDFCTQLFFFF